MKYRPEIDGLRAISVLAILLFHSGIPFLGHDYFKGGFLGVDIFFVISGYLISKILITEINDNRFSFKKFYERRARRILMPLLVMILLCSIAGWFLVDPERYLAFAKSAVAILFFSSNLFFYSESGYFDQVAETKPLLHTWSLSVEEQFYLFFPLLLIALFKYVPNRKRQIIFGAALVSFLFSSWLNSKNPSLSFYILPTRAWELLLGSYVAICEFEGLYKNQRNWQSYYSPLGLIMVCVSIFGIKESLSGASFLLFLIPTVGAALILAYGERKNIASLILKSKPMVAVGVTSYSIYLWHQPYLALNRVQNFGYMSEKRLIIFFPFVIICAWLSWKFIEKPFRDYKTVSSKLFIRTVAFSAASLLIFLCFLVSTKGAAFRINFPASLSASMVGEIVDYKCMNNPNVATENSKDWFCTVGDDTKPIEYVVFGDSHAYAALPAFTELAVKHSRRAAIVNVSSCIPLLGLEMHSAAPNDLSFHCEAINKRVFNLIRENKIKHLILIARWTAYYDWSLVAKPIGGAPAETKLERKQIFKQALIATISEYTKIGTQLTIVSQAPIQLYHATYIYYAAYLKPEPFRESIIRKSSVPYGTYREMHKYINQLGTELTGGNFEYVNIDKYFCDKEFCPVGNLTESFYFGDNHLSYVGAKKLVPALEHLIKK